MKIVRFARFKKIAFPLHRRMLPATALVVFLLMPQTIGSDWANSDNNGLSEAVEFMQGTNPFDTDGDGVLNDEEVNLYNTNPSNSDSDGDASSDGIEIEIETNPLNSSSRPLYSRTISFSSVTQEAFNLKQSTYRAPIVQNIPALDPPLDGNPGSPGLVFRESNAIRPNSNLIDQLQWYAFARPRAALDKLRFRVYIDNNNDDVYDLRTYANANLDYSSSIIQPPIDTALLPIAGKVLSRFVIGHAQPGMGYPQFFDINANGYGRFNGYAPQTVGASYRVALHNVFAPNNNEDFPRFREIYFRIPNTNESNLIGLVDSEGFTGAVNMNLRPGQESTMQVSAKFFPRRNILISNEPHTGLVGFSSMFWKNEDDTTEVSTDEAHDSDVLVVGYDRDGNGIIDIIVERDIDNPPNLNDLTVTDFSMFQTGKQIYFALENRDRNASHYSSYASATYETRSSYSIQLISSNIPLSMILYEEHTASEVNDNIVVNLAIKQNLLEASSVADAVTVEYITKAYFPVDTDGDGLTNQLERLVGTDINNSDSDRDGGSDHLELLTGTDPCSGCVDIDVLIARSNMGRYGLLPGKSLREGYAGVDNGPVKVTSTLPIVASERVIYSPNGTPTSFSQMMALPNSQLDSTYWLPWYNNVDLDTQLRIANVSGSQATITVTIGGVPKPSFNLAVGASTRVSYAGVNGGPVKIVSTQNIVAAERVIYKVNNVNTSFSEMMALPQRQLDNIYYLPWYNNVDLDTQLRIANVSGSQATITVTIGGVPKPSFNLAAGASTRVSYAGTNNGPVKIVSTQNIVAAERVIYKVNNVNTSFSEMMALPANQLDSTYWLPWYNNVDLDTQLRFGNVSGSTATVHVFIGGSEVNGSPFTLAPGASTRKSFTGVNNGPLQVVSDVDIVAAERMIYKVNGINTSFSEMMALPGSQLNAIYWLPWYNNVDLDTQLRFGVP